MNNYRVLGRIGEGAHGIVMKARHVVTGNVVALKAIQLRKLESGISCATLREMKTLQQVQHENVVKLLDVLPHGSGIILAFEYVTTNLSVLLRDPDLVLSKSQIKSYLQMLLKGISYCHSQSVLHRDLKPANLLICSNGCLKIADFGQARLFVKEGNRVYSHEVATRWYRAPELLYGALQYDEGVDLWSVGCIFGEMLNRFPLFRGENDIEQMCLVFRALGTPAEETWPGVTELPDYKKISFPHYEPTPIEELVPDACNITLDLLQSFLVYDSKKRIPADQALLHTYFFTCPLPCCACELFKPDDNKHNVNTNMSSSIFNVSEDIKILAIKMDSLKDSVTATLST